MSKEKVSDIESDLYSNINTILNLYRKYKKGILTDNFFQKSIKNSMKELLKINFLLKEQNLLISDILNNMNFTKAYYKAIEIINHVSALNFPSNHSNKSKSMLEIPGVTAKITSSFITLMDALKLDALNNKSVTTNLFEDLKHNLVKFPGLELIQIEFEKLYNYVLTNYPKVAKDKKFRDLIGDDLYKLYRQFQDKLNLKD